MIDPHQREDFTQTLAASPLLSPILASWEHIDLPDCWLVAGVLVQTVWNRAHGFDVAFGISDIDLVYHDADDLSEESEAGHSRRINSLFAGLGLPFDVKNEARVHLWYAAKFGDPIAPYVSAEAAIATFPTTAGAIGIRPSAEGLELCAPFGLDDLLGLVVRPNKRQITQPIYEAKVARWRRLWPRLTILPWDA
ncbi:nucleotidyltransferase family protein [Pelagibius sp.]|uniref:nucleotidyltransferase family protein n=1 Tax=Pelagibius sp. TaxID=1931238 RepID=UPI002AC35855|nr:nucleotidyltransferase family protein [Pelagibius sp.]